MLHDANSVLEALLEYDGSSAPEELVLRDALEPPELDAAGSVRLVAVSRRNHSVRLLLLRSCCRLGRARRRGLARARVEGGELLAEDVVHVLRGRDGAKDLVVAQRDLARELERAQLCNRLATSLQILI